MLARGQHSLAFQIRLTLPGYDFMSDASIRPITICKQPFFVSKAKPRPAPTASACSLTFSSWIGATASFYNVNIARFNGDKQASRIGLRPAPKI